MNFIKKRLNMGHNREFAIETAITIINELYNGPTVKSVLI